jgi:energy-coupling factor transport system ATP-binding protein
LMGLMARLRERYRTSILMITHDVRLVAEWADRALVISGGRLLFDGSPEAMFADDALIADAGLLAPPVYEISKALAAKHPGSLLRPTLSLPLLADTIARIGGESA